MSQHFYFYPTAAFPSKNENVRYDIHGSLVPNEQQNNLIKANPLEQVPEVTPAGAPGYIPISVPIAHSLNDSSSSKSSEKTGSSSTNPKRSDNTFNPTGVSSISQQDAIKIDAERKKNHPSADAYTTNTPSASLPSVRYASVLPVPLLPSNTKSSMAGGDVQQTVRVMDTIINKS